MAEERPEVERAKGSEERSKIGTSAVMVHLIRCKQLTEMSTAAPNALDVRPLPTDRKLPTVLSVLKDLEVGDSFVLVDNRDPTVLRARIGDKWSGEARWAVLEEGPPVWYVRVRRRPLSV